MIEILTNIQTYFMGHYTQWLIFFAIFVVGFFAIKLVNSYIAHLFDKVHLDRTLEVIIQKTVKIFLWIILLIIILSNMGFNVTGFVAGLGAMGIVVGFATKDVLSNLAAGIFLLINKPFKVGDSVDVVKIKGKVSEMSIGTCIIITEDNQYVTIPNSKIWGGPIKNLSRLK